LPPRFQDSSISPFSAESNPKARSADPKRFVEARFLKELNDSGFAAQVYR
jgi:hypothetical protein